MNDSITSRRRTVRFLAGAPWLLLFCWSSGACHRRNDAHALATRPAPAASESTVSAVDKRAQAEDAKTAPPSANQVAVAAEHTYILTAGETILAIGRNDYGALGLAKDVKQTSVPTSIPGIAGARQVAAGTRHACALIAGGKVVCWGRDFGGALGIGPSKKDDFIPPTMVVSLSEVEEIGAAGTHSCARLADGTVQCWGCVIDGTHDRPEVLPKLSHATSLAIAEESSCARREDKGVVCWDLQLGMRFAYGEAINGGDGNIKPVTPVPGLRDVRQVSVSMTHACAVTEAGSVYCWGFGVEGELGNGVSGGDYHLLRPAQVPGLTEIEAVATGNGYSCAVHRQGELYCWGQNGHGQLGVGDKRLRTRPEKLQGLTNVATVALGTQHSCATTRNGEVYCWGRNHYGQVGQAPTGPADARSTPTRVTW